MQHATSNRPGTRPVTDPVTGSVTTMIHTGFKSLHLSLVIFAATLAGTGAIAPALALSETSTHGESALQVHPTSNKQFAGKQFAEKPDIEKYLNAEQFAGQSAGQSAEQFVDSQPDDAVEPRTDGSDSPE